MIIYATRCARCNPEHERKISPEAFSEIVPEPVQKEAMLSITNINLWKVVVEYIDGCPHCDPSQQHRIKVSVGEMEESTRN